jgi:hypothetical protein
MELIIYKPTENNFLKTIEFNFDELKTELTNRLEKYQNLVYSDDEIKLAKTDRATLNKLLTAIDNKRKEIKTLCLQPYEAFEIKVKELITLISKPITQIDAGIKTFEEKVKSAKKVKIMDIYNENIHNLKDLVPFEKLFNEKMLNATSKLTTIETEITERINQINTDIDVINGLKSQFELQIKDAYMKDFNLSFAMAEGTRFEEQKKKIEDLEAKKKVEVNQEEPKPVIKEKIPETIPEEKTVYLDPELITYTLDFRITATKDQILSLKKFLTNNNIKYERI